MRLCEITGHKAGSNRKTSLIIKDRRESFSLRQRIKPWTAKRKSSRNKQRWSHKSLDMHHGDYYNKTSKCEKIKVLFSTFAPPMNTSKLSRLKFLVNEIQSKCMCFCSKKSRLFYVTSMSGCVCCFCLSCSG